MDDLLGGPYDEWIRPVAGIPALGDVLNRSLWNTAFVTCAGTLAAALMSSGWDHLLDVMVLLDLKTLGPQQPHLLNPCPAGGLPQRC